LCHASVTQSRTPSERAASLDLAQTLRMQDPAEVSRGLEEIAALLSFSGEPAFKVRAYEHAARIVDTLGHELAPVIEQSRLRTIAGIGAVLSGQIQELWNTGASELLVRLRHELPEGAAELIRVEGMTPRRIRALNAALGIRSVPELLAACRAGRVQTVPGFGQRTEQRLLDAGERWLGRAQDAPPQLLMSHGLELADMIERELARVGARARVTGALRRCEEVVNELEFVVLGDVRAALEQLSSLRQVVRVELERARAQLVAGVPVQLHAAEPDLGNALFFATGNSAHVAAVCARARCQGFDLAGSPVSGGLPARTFASEEALYGSVGLPAVPPELRQGTDELDRATHTGFDNLIEERDIQGMVHCHTDYSDGKNTILEMARAAHALGMKYITITDHSQSAHYANGVTLDRLKQQWDEIAAAQEHVPIRILRGIEADILIDGSLDFPDAMLERFDVIIASIHARHRLDRQRMTARLVRALSIPIFKIWGHGLGRILNHRPPIDCDVPKVLDALARSQGAVELNADPHRLDLPACWLPAVRERGIRFVISVDAHSTRGFGVLRHGVALARRGGVHKQEVLNTLLPEHFTALVKPV
jgi:DNA polymerase (family X)